MKFCELECVFLEFLGVFVKECCFGCDVLERDCVVIGVIGSGFVCIIKKYGGYG